jgi:transposase InsO family protein
LVSKAKLIITAVVVQGRSQAQVAAEFGVSKGWVSKLMARYRAEGDAAFTARSRRPHTSPGAIDDAVVQRILGLRHRLTAAGLDAGPDTIAWHLHHHHNVTVSPATIARYLTKAGLVTPEPQKRPKTSYTRFQAAMPNECWQSDFTHYPLLDGTDTEIITWLDDCTRMALHVSVHQRITAAIVTTTFRDTVEKYGVPASTLTDNGMVYTVRLAAEGRHGGRTSFENELRRLHIVQKNSRPNHPTTCGKVERFQQTLKKWLRAQPDQPATITELQTLIDSFTADYNHDRPHRSLPHRAPPATGYTHLPKATPTTDRTEDAHHRIRHDIIDTDGKLTLRHNGRLHHIGIGRTHARTPIIMIIHDLNIRVINATTGEILRELTLDTTKDYQPQNQGNP